MLQLGVTRLAAMSLMMARPLLLVLVLLPLQLLLSVIVLCQCAYVIGGYRLESRWPSRSSAVVPTFVVDVPSVCVVTITRLVNC